jgi:hypothetical protein
VTSFIQSSRSVLCPMAQSVMLSVAACVDSFHFFVSAPTLGLLKPARRSCGIATDIPSNFFILKNSVLGFNQPWPSRF